MSKTRSLSIATIMICCFSPAVNAAVAEPFFPGNVAEYLLDEQDKIFFSRLSLAAVSNSFRSNLSPQFVFGLNSTVRWIRFKLPGSIAAHTKKGVKFLLYPDIPTPGYLKVYFPIQGGGYTVKEWRMDQPLSRDTWDNLFAAFTLPRQPDPDRFVYVRMRSPFTANFKLIIEPQVSTAAYTFRLGIFITGVFGVILAMLIYNLMLYITLRLPMLLSYAGYLLAVLLFQSGDLGLVYLIDSRLAADYVPYSVLFSYFSAAFYLRFVWQFLDVKKNAPLTANLYIIVWVICLLGTAIFFSGELLLSNQLGYLTAALYFPLILFTVFLLKSRGTRISRFYLYAMTMLIFSMGLYITRGTGVLPAQLPTKYILFFFVALETLFSSFALADRVRTLRQDKLRLLRHTAKQQKDREIADAANRTKSVFLANMSHEIRTPLNAVIGFARLLHKTPLTKLQIQYTDNITVSSHSLLGIINDILDFSKIEAGKMALEQLETDPESLIYDAVTIVQYQAAEKGIELLVRLDPQLPATVTVDPLRLKQVLVNLLSNAVKFTAAGEVEISLSFQRVDSKSGVLSFAVRDTGIGISGEQQRYIFDAFSQADISTTRKYGGSGLGLSITGMLVQHMGGELQLESEPGSGTIFHFKIKTGCSEKRTPFTCPFQSVMVLTGNRRSREILSETFSSRGIKTIAPRDTKSALELLKSNNSIPLLLLDLHLPERSGLTFLDQLSESGQPVVMLLNAVDSAETRAGCLEKGVLFTATKPVNPLQLLTEAGKILHRSETVEPAPGSRGSGAITHYSGQILIVEDVTVNRELLEAVLYDLMPHITVCCAADGDEGIILFKQNQFDLIFMDIQMPVLDGLSAARSIRKIEREQRVERTPIIALSAAAGPENRSKALEAGMDRFLTKPLIYDRLQEILQEYCSCETRPDKQQNNPPSPGFPEKISGIDLSAGLEMLGGNSKLYLQHLCSFPRREQQKITELKKLVTREESGDAVRMLHSLQGLAANLAITAVQRSALELEHNLYRYSTEELIGRLNHLSGLLHQLEKDLAPYCK